MAPDVLIDANDLHAFEPRGIVDQQPLAFSQDRVGGGVPRDPESLGDTGRIDAFLAALHQAVKALPQPHQRFMLLYRRRLDRGPGQLLHVGQPEAPCTVDISL